MLLEEAGLFCVVGVGRGVACTQHTTVHLEGWLLKLLVSSGHNLYVN